MTGSPEGLFLPSPFTIQRQLYDRHGRTRITGQLLNCLATNKPSQGVTMAANQLHVIFHGQFCFSQKEREIKIHVPLVWDNERSIPAHVYMAGNWLNERVYGRNRDFELMGVVTGKGSFDRGHNLVLHKAKLIENPGVECYASMTFPRPHEIHSLQRAKKTEKWRFTGDDTRMVAEVQEVATVQVFTYDIKGSKELQLRGIPATVFPADGTLVDEHLSLHIFAQPDFKPSGSAHNSHDALKTAISMYRHSHSDKKVSLDIAGEPEVSSKNDKLPDSLLAAELEDLPTRFKRISAVGVGWRKAKKTGEAPKNLEDGGVDASDPLNCFSLVTEE